MGSLTLFLGIDDSLRLKESVSPAGETRGPIKKSRRGGISVDWRIFDRDRV
jgi:hypothetical protein